MTHLGLATSGGGHHGRCPDRWLHSHAHHQPDPDGPVAPPSLTVTPTPTLSPEDQKPGGTRRRGSYCCGRRSTDSWSTRAGASTSSTPLPRARR